MKYAIKNRNSSNVYYVDSKKSLNFFYENFFGRVLLKIMITKTFSNICSLYLSSRLSIPYIKSFVKTNNIDMSDFEDKKYKSYNEFFTRKIKPDRRIIDTNKDSFISPCDSKLSVYSIKDDLTLNIKDSFYSIDTLVDTNIMNDYKDGYALVFRLDTTDYHRYLFIDDGVKEEDVSIKGKYHTVQPISLNRYNFYKTNHRVYSVLHTKNFGDVISVEIGAMCIGKIVNNDLKEFHKGEEKGYFKFGGSTIVLLVKKDTIVVDKDILDNSKNNIETIVKYGEKVAIKLD